MRVFLALRLNEEIRNEIGRAQRLLRKVAPYGVSFNLVEQLHLTLRFIPDATEKHIPKLIEAMQELSQKVPPFDLTLNSCGSFPSHGLLRVIWATVMEASHEPIILCHGLCEESARKLGFEIEDKPYVPHITFARVKRHIPHQALREAVSKIKLAPVQQRIDSITLFQSDLTIRGAVHTELHSEPLKKTVSEVCAA